MEQYDIHNQFRAGLDVFITQDPHLNALSQLQYQYSPNWWYGLTPQMPGIYILTGGRQIGKSTSCKLLIKYCLEKRVFSPSNIFYLPCDEIFDAKALSQTIRSFLQSVNGHFLLVVDEVTYVKHWERVVKALADEGQFKQGICILTGSDTLILKEAAMSFPGRRGNASNTDFHMYPLSFKEYVDLVSQHDRQLDEAFEHYLVSGGYLRAINDYAVSQEVRPATYQTYEQWIRGDFLKQGKHESHLLNVLATIFKTGVSHISYSALTQNIGSLSKDTCIAYCDLLERMDVLFTLQAFDQNKKQGSPKKDRKFHFLDPFIQNTIYRWLCREGLLAEKNFQSSLVEAAIASHCKRLGKAYYFKGKGEVDVISFTNNSVKAVEVKWANQVRPNDLNMLKQFKDSYIVTKPGSNGKIDHIQVLSAASFLYHIDEIL